MIEETKRFYYPLRPMQRWITDSLFLKAKSTMMNMNAVFKLDMSIDMQRLADALNGIVNAHDIFRCRLDFHPETNDICQRFDGEITPVKVEKISDEEFQSLLKNLSVPYTSIKEQLWRMRLFETPTAKYFFFDAYHGIMDGTAVLFLFWRELDARYIGKQIKRVPMNYADYITEELNTPADLIEEGNKYFRDMLKDFDIEKHLLPPDLDLTPDETIAKGDFEYPIKSVTHENLLKADIKETFFFLGATMIALAKSAGAKSSILNMVHNGRVGTKELRLMGIMLEHLPVAWNFENDCTVEEFLNGIEEVFNKSLGYRKSMGMVYNEGLEDDCATFIFQKRTLGLVGVQLKLGGTTVEVFEPPANEYSAAEAYLNIETNLCDDGTYIILFEYYKDAYSEDAIKKFAALYDEIVPQLQDKNKSVSEILNA